MTEASSPAGTATAAGSVAPRIVAEVRADGTGFLTVGTVREEVVGADLAEVGAQITARIASLAGRYGTPLPAEVRDPDGLWVLLVHPDGRVDEAPTSRPGGLRAGTSADAGPAGPSPSFSSPLPAPAASSSPAGTPSPFPRTGVAADLAGHTAPTLPSGVLTGSPAAPGTRPEPRPDVREPAAASGHAAVAAAPVAGQPTEVQLGEALAHRHRPRRQVATRGWRVGLRRATLGLIKPGPGRRERTDRAAVESVRRPLAGPRTIVVINPKGGAHKTTATLLLASAFGLQRGGYTLAWDNNETHGTLGWRSATNKAGRSALDLLQALPELSSRGEIRVGDLDGYVRSQTAEQFDVLASDDDAASGAFVDAESFAALHQVLTRFYRVLVVDTGNNIRSSNWRAAVAAADQLVIVTTIREDTAQSAAWAVDALRAAGLTDAVRDAVTILSASSANVDKDLRKRLRHHFGVLTREVVEVPFDPALVAGGPIEYSRLKRSTRDAWLRATAAVAEGL